ncbi:MAG: DUF1549 domain-containing protein [Pirellulales bacterium]
MDRFVAAKLDEHSLTPSPEAGRAVLIKRLMIDLIGLPPTPEEVESFVHNDAPDAYERLVDRLLASPRFGERLALPWLDAARYADSNGFRARRRYMAMDLARLGRTCHERRLAVRSIHDLATCR